MTARIGSLAVAVVAVAVVALVVGAGTRPAHLSAVSPADGATVAVPPDSVSLTFTAAVDPARSHAGAAAANGTPVAAGNPAVAGSTLVLPVRITRPGGYLVAYHVVLAGGGELTGATRFTVAAGGDVPGSPAAAPAQAADGHAHGVDPFGLALIVLDAVLIVVVLAVTLRRRAPADKR